MREQEHNGVQNGASVWLKIGLAMLPVAAALITMWADVRELKNQRADRISGERIAKAESEIDQLQREVTINRGHIESLWRRQNGQ